MSDFFAFVLIIFSAVWGSVFLGVMVKRLMDDVGSKADGPLIDDLRDEMAQLVARLDDVDEELSFLRELRKPKPPGRLEPPQSPDS